MKNLNTATDGKKANVYLLSFGEAISTGTLTKGKWYCIKSIGTGTTGLSKSLLTTTSAPLAPGEFFYASTAVALGEGDSVELVSQNFLGFAKDKSLSQSKGTIDVTCDENKRSSNFIADGNVNISGSINGVNLATNDPEASINILRKEFQTIHLGDETGKVTKIERTDNKLVLMFDWRDNNSKAGDLFEVNIIPCVISSLDNSASYGSAMAFNINFQGCDEDFEGRKCGYLVGALVA